MSDAEHMLEEGEYDIVDVDVQAWVEAARSNPTQYRNRQVTEIVLAAIGLAPSLNTNLVLKGGAVMALVFKSNRITADVDFTSMVEPAGFADQIADDLNAVLPRTAIRLGYLDLLCRVQTVKKMPKSLNFEEFEFPGFAHPDWIGRARDRRREALGSREGDTGAGYRNQLPGPGICVSGTEPDRAGGGRRSGIHATRDHR